MLKAVSVVLTMIMSLVVVGSLVAAEGKSHKEGKHPPRPSEFDLNPIDMVIKDLTLTDAQKTKVAELKKVYDPKFEKARENLDTILTDEQKKAKKEALEAGKDRKDLWKILQLTEAQMAKLGEGQKTLQTLRKEAREKVMSILTPEQKKQVKKAMADRINARSKDGRGPGGPGNSEGGNGSESK